MTRMGDSSFTVMMNWFHHFLEIDFSVFGRHTLHPHLQDGASKGDLNKGSGTYFGKDRFL
jgi:hypothetical protein